MADPLSHIDHVRCIQVSDTLLIMSTDQQLWSGVYSVNILFTQTCKYILVTYA